jgi:MarR family transcriptional regulator, multiple antibiotic resistance protein MarR
VTEPTGLFVRLVAYETALYNRLEERLRAEHGITAGQFEFLRFVDRGEARTVGELATVVGITIGAVSKAVDRLEATGWLARSPNPANRRSSLLGLTPAGQAVLEQATPTADAALHDWVVAPLSARALAQFDAALATLHAALDAAE